MNLTAKPMPNGDLLVTADNAMRSNLAEALRSDRGYWSAFADLFESYSCNGSYTPFDAGEGNPFVGLTSAPCIAESMDYPDSGEAEIVGRLWWFPHYAIDDPLQELARHGRTVFTLADESAA